MIYHVPTGTTATRAFARPQLERTRDIVSSQALCWIVQAPLRLLRGCWGMCCRCREGIEESLDGEAHRRDRVWLTLRGPNEVRRRREGGEGRGGHRCRE
eukprot:COSAG01_NODE_677_length_14312_cov_10.195314_11_plen_99_part_00